MIYIIGGAIIIVPEDTPYEHDIFKLDIVFTSDYPLKPPKITFTTPIHHINVSSTGKIFLSILGNNWAAKLTISNLLLTIRYLLDDPDLEFSATPEISRSYSKNQLEFEKKAREWTIKYARISIKTSVDIKSFLWIKIPKKDILRQPT
jgi:ubiquitin-conjugating enzyme E2 D/E